MRNLRTLGVALIAMLAVSAGVAGAAQAQTHFLAGNGTGTAKYKVEQESTAPVQSLTTDAGTLECEEFHAEGTGSASATGVELSSVEYGECEFNGLAIVPPKFNSCHYVIQANGRLVLAPAKCEVTFGLSGCTVTMEGRQEPPGVNYTNVQESGKKKELKANAAVGGLAYSWSGKGCPGSSSGSDTNGLYKGKFKVRATDTSNNPIDLAVVSRFRAGDGSGTAQITLGQDSSNPLQVFTMDSGNIECEEVQAEGTNNATTAEVDLTSVEYKECATYGGHIGFGLNPCHYRFYDVGIFDLAQSPGTTCEVHIFTNPNCIVTLKPQTGLELIGYTNVHELGKPKEVIAQIEISNLSYSWTGSNCLGGFSGSKSNGTYDGTVRLKAFTAGGTQEDLVFE
jgi:hypothetical protein